MSKKTIYVEGMGLVEGHFSGVGQYILGILRGMDELIEEAKYAGKNYPTVKVIVPYNMVPRFRSFSFKHIDHKSFPLPFRHMGALWYIGKLPPIDLWCGRGFYIFPRFVNMPLAFSKSANVIYDLSYELYRQFSDERNAKFLSRRVGDTIKSTHRVITISQNAKKEIVDFYSVNPEHVLVATPAADPTIFYRRAQKEIDEVKHKYGINGDYILALSNLEPRKNLDSLVDAYCALPEPYRKDTGLLLVGVSGWKTDMLFDKIVDKVKQGYNIIRPSKYVSDDDKPAIISGAKLLVYPSHYEGFGMPPLEALACGVPVITADNSSLPEVVKGVGKMINSSDIDALKSSIEEGLKNNAALTEKIKTAGPAQAEKFSWKQSAQIYFDLAKELGE